MRTVEVSAVWIQCMHAGDSYHLRSVGSALSSTLIRRMKALNLKPTQVYGLTETYGKLEEQCVCTIKQ